MTDSLTPSSPPAIVDSDCHTSVNSQDTNNNNTTYQHHHHQQHQQQHDSTSSDDNDDTQHHHHVHPPSRSSTPFGSNPNLQQSQSMMLEESDAEFLERGLLQDEMSKYISNENTPGSIRPIDNRCDDGNVDDYPPAIDLNDENYLSLDEKIGQENKRDGKDGEVIDNNNKNTNNINVDDDHNHTLKANDVDHVGDHPCDHHTTTVHQNIENHNMNNPEKNINNNNEINTITNTDSTTPSSIALSSKSMFSIQESSNHTSDDDDQENHGNNNNAIKNQERKRLYSTEKIKNVGKMKDNNEISITTSSSSSMLHSNEYDNDDDKHVITENSEETAYISEMNTDDTTNLIHLSKSYHRRLHEAAQFAEAIGEVPQDGMIQVIINDDDDVNDDDDDDDDDDDNNDNEESIEKNHQLDEDGGNLSKQDVITLNLSLTNDLHESMDDPMIDKSFDDSDNMVVKKETINELNTSTSTSALSAVYENDESRTATPLSSPATKMAHQMSISRIPSGLLKSQSTRHYFAHPLPSLHPEDDSTDYEYKGIKHNPPEVTKRGISRGNYAQLHRKAWLEVSDKYHRYGKNLRMYYKHWVSLGHPTNMFFDWLDSKNEAAGCEKPELEECPRSILDSDRVTYVTDLDEQNKFLLKIESRERISTLSTGDNTVSTPVTCIVDCNGDVVRTGTNGWIFVLRDHELYGGEKVTSRDGNSKFRFHHSSFFGGKAVAAAGILITDDDGCLKRLYPHSGHYRPGEAHMQRMLFYLYQSGVDLNSFEVDMQQIMHVSRDIRDENTPKGGREDNTKKAKKVDSLHLHTATYVALFLAHKAKMIRNGVLSKIHMIRSIHCSQRSVTNVLDFVDRGGHLPLQTNQ